MAATFCAHAAIFATWAPRIPSIKAELGLGHGELGIALGGMAVGLLLGTRLTGRLERRARTRRPMRILMPVQALALLGPAYAPNLITLTVALVALGVVGGVIDVAMNAHAVSLERLYRRPIMSGFHGLWSLGTMGASAAAAAVASLGVDVRLHFAIAAVVTALASAPLMALLLPGDEESSSRPRVSAAETEAHPDRPPASLLVVAILAVVGFGSFVTEGTVADWGAVFLHENRGASVGLAALGLSVFSGAMAVSRLAGDRLGMWLGPVGLVRLGAFLAAVGLAATLLIDQPLVSLIGFTVLGLGIGPVVPVVFSAGGNTPTRNRSSILGIVVSAGYVGGVVGPVMIGWLASHLGLVWALAMPLVFLILMLSTAQLLGGAAGSTQRDPGEAEAEPAGPLHH